MATSGTFFNTFPPVGTMRNGLLSEAATLPAPLLESEYCWLPSPGALSSNGKGRPPGHLINKGEVLNPAILCQWYEIPESWLDPSESRAATELLESNEQQQEIFSILESPPSLYNESSTSTPCVENQQPLTRANAKAGTYVIDQSETLGIIKDNWGFGFVVDWFSSQFTYNWERDDRLIGELAIAPQSLIAEFLEDKSEPLVLCPSCESQHIYLSGGCGMCGLEPDMQRTQQLQSLQIGEGLRPTIGQRVHILKTRTQNLSQWVGYEPQ